MSNCSDIEAALNRLEPLDPHQVAIWRAMTPVQRLEVAFQLHQLALDAVRVTERQRHPELGEAEMARRVCRRMLGFAPGER